MRQMIGTGLLLATLTTTLWGQDIVNERDATRVPLIDDRKPAANAQAAVPVKGVVLFSSGVGYFDHFGSIKGDGSTELRFKTAQINDILKSLVLQDLDGGKVMAVTYPSQDPVEKTLKSFQVDITANPTLGDLLNQLRGADVTLVMSDSKIAGVVLGVEKKQKPVDDKAVIERPAVNLMTDSGIKSIYIEDVQEVQLKDPKLREELKQALSALAAARDQDKKPVKIAFQGQGDRRVRIGYVVETPVWKTSYRLILGNAVAKAPAAGEADKAKPDAAAPSASLQGWAIVENQTDNDWDHVQLSLVSGRPISFIQDLYRPLYIPRPTVQPEVYAGVVGGIDTGGIAGHDMMKKAEVAARPAPNSMRERRALMQQLASSAADGSATEANQPIDPTASVASLASASKVGELFQYTVGDVSLPRQSSAMIPIVTDAVEVERLSIYNASILPRNPLNGARVKNTTGKHLLAGPVTVLDAGTYAGDARVDNVPPGQERLLSYGVDLQMLVNAEQQKQESWLRTAKLVKGVLMVSNKILFTQTYTVQNKADTDRTLIVEHPVRPNWQLEDTAAPIESTDAVHRFKVNVPTGKTESLTVKQGSTQVEGIALVNTAPNALLFYINAKEIPDDVKAALAKVAGMQQDIQTTQQKIAEIDAQLAAITTEQQRIRENMKTVDKASAYYNRLAAKLNDQESKIETFQTQRDELQKSLEAQQKTLADHLNGLTIG